MTQPSQASKSSAMKSCSKERKFLAEFDPSKPRLPHIIPPREYEGQRLKLLPGLNISYKWNRQKSMKTDASVDEASRTHGSGRRDEWLPSVENISVDTLKDDLRRLSLQEDDPEFEKNNYVDRLKDDLKRLSLQEDDPGFEEFSEVPVEGFGAACLAGYGWYEERGIGKNAKEEFKVEKISGQIGKQGLGFASQENSR